jgi:hypothetical protein
MTITQESAESAPITKIDTPARGSLPFRAPGEGSHPVFACSAEALARFTAPPLRTRAILEDVKPRSTGEGRGLGQHKLTRIYKGKGARFGA